MDYTQLTNEELTEALNFHRRQRNMSRGINESAHARQTQMVRLLEAEETRRLEEATTEHTTYHYYVTKNDTGAGRKQLTHSKKKPFTTERDAFEHILKSGGRQSGIIHKVHAETGKIVKNRGVDGGQRGYTSSVSQYDPLHVKDLKEEVEQIDEISDEMKKRYHEKGREDVYNRFTGRGKYEKPRNPDNFTKTGRHKKNALNSPESVKYREKIASRNKYLSKVASQLNKEEAELSEEWYKDKDGKEYPFSKPFDSKTDAHEFAKKNGLGKSTVKSRPAGYVVEKPSVHEEAEQIDEISKSTLGSYASKALNRGDIAARMSHKDDDEMGKIANKRLTGVKKAVDKIAPKSTATRIKANVDKAKEAARHRYTDKDDQGKAYYAAQKGIAKVREETDLYINEVNESYIVHSADCSYYKKFSSLHEAKAHYNEIMTE